jgi:hypothetical protein
LGPLFSMVKVFWLLVFILFVLSPPMNTIFKFIYHQPIPKSTKLLLDIWIESNFGILMLTTIIYSKITIIYSKITIIYSKITTIWNNY